MANEKWEGGMRVCLHLGGAAVARSRVCLVTRRRSERGIASSDERSDLDTFWKSCHPAWGMRQLDWYVTSMYISSMPDEHLARRESKNPTSYSVHSMWYLACDQMAWDPLCILGIGYYSRHQRNTLSTNPHIPKPSGTVKKNRRAPT